MDHDIESQSLHGPGVAVPAQQQHEMPRPAYPSSEEMRMTKALMQSAVEEALLRGESQACFHGFRINAARWPCMHDHDIAMTVELVVELWGHRINHEVAHVSADASCFR